MRGYPPFHVFFLILAFAGMAVPLYRLTQPKAHAAAVGMEVSKPTTARNHTGYLRVRFAHTPTSLSVKLGDREMLPGAELKASPVETRLDLQVPEEGIEFIVSTAWPAGTPSTALSLEVEADGLDTKTETRWSTGTEMTEVIGFKWK